jgi:hypothetical protein
LVVNPHINASRYSQPGAWFIPTRSWVFVLLSRPAYFHFLQFWFLFLQIFPGYHGSMRKSGILYPNQHIDSDCFSAALPIFELFSHTIPFDAHPSSSSIDGRTLAFSEEACITNISRLRSFCKHAAWGAIDSRFPSHPHADDHSQHFLIYDKSDSFSRSYLSATMSFSSSSCLSISSHAKNTSMAVRDDEKVCCIDGVREGLTTTPTFFTKEYTPVLCGNRHGGCLFTADLVMGLEKEGFGLHLPVY